MESLSIWIQDIGKLVIFLGIVKIGYNWLWKAFNGSGKFM